MKDMDPKSAAMMEAAIIPVLDRADIELGSSEKGSTFVPEKSRKKTMTSAFLKYFETAADGKSRRCKFCGQSYSIATATGNLGRHLSNRHPGYDNVEDISTPTHAQLVTVVKKPPDQVKESHARVKEPQMELDHLNWLLIKWQISACVSPSTLEEKWLLNSFKFLNPAIHIWSGERCAAVLNEVFRSMREDVRVMIDHVSSKVSITLDFWTSYDQFLYMSVTCQWIDENWLFQKILLDICHVSYPSVSPEIYPALMKILKFYNIVSRVLSCTHDNSEHAVRACRTLKDDMDTQKLGPFCYIPCAAQTLNSIVHDGIASTKSIISKVREFVIEMNASSQISEDFVQFSAAYQEGNWRFPLDTSVRWSGNYQMLDIVRKASKSMDTIIRKYKELLGSRVLLSSAEKNAVNIMHAYLEPFYKTITNICTTKVLTIGLVLFFMDHISEMIAACRDSRHNPDWLKAAAQEMAVKAQSYNDEMCNVFSYMSAVLDPRIKVELIPECLNAENYLEEARNHFIRNYSSSHFPSITSSYAAQGLEDGGPVSFAEEIARKRRRATMPSVTDELSRYLSEPPASLSTDVLEWWNGNNARYPRLSMMARDFLAVQPTAIAAEYLFSCKGDEIAKERCSLSHSSGRSLLCVRSWMEAGFKLKYRSTEIDFERIMELAAAPAARVGTTVSDEKRKG